MPTDTEAPANPLARIVQESGIETVKANLIVDTLGPLAIEAADLIQKSKDIIVTDATQVSEMKAACTARKAIKDVRGRAEKGRKELKSDVLVLSRLIDSCGNLIKDECEKAETRLQESEEFAIRKEAERKAATKKAREAILAPFGIDVTFYNLADMPEATFTELLESTRLAAEAKKAAAKKAEDDRLAAIAAKAEEDRLLREERDRLAREAAEKEAALKAERERVNRERMAAEATAKAERDAIEAKGRKEREAIAEADRKERLALQAKADTERQKAEAKAKAEREAAAKKLAAEQAARKRVESASADLLAALKSALADEAGWRERAKAAIDKAEAEELPF